MSPNISEENEVRAVGVINDELVILEKKLDSPDWRVDFYRGDTDEPHTTSEDLPAEEAQELVGGLVNEYKLVVEKSRQSIDTGELENYRVVSVESCSECGGTLVKNSTVTTATGFADSYSSVCSECGETQHVPAW